MYWCTADIGWVTGHSYIVYGPLANGATTVMYEGTPDWPDKDRFWRIVEKYGVTILYTAPTAIRTFVRWGDEYPKRCDLSSLRLLGTVGEPINPEAWVWYWKVIGGGRCPVVDTWWQTETGHILITPLPGTTVCKPGSATHAVPGDRGRGRERQGGAGPGGLSRAQAAVARHAARHLRRPGALPAPVLEPDPRRLLHRGRVQAGQGRLLLAPGPDRRRDEHLRPSRLDHGGGVGAGRPPGGRRGGGHRPAARDQGPGDRGVRHDQASGSRRRTPSRTRSSSTSRRRSARWRGPTT